MPSSVVKPKDCPAIRSALDGGRRHGLWQAATHDFALAAPIGRGGRSCVSAFGFRPDAGCGPARAGSKPRTRLRDGAQGRPCPHQVHHRAGALGRVPGLLAHQSQPRLRRAARRHAAAAAAAGRGGGRPRQVVPRRPVGARQGPHRHRRHRAGGGGPGGNREEQGRQDRPAGAGDRARRPCRGGR